MNAPERSLITLIDLLQLVKNRNVYGTRGNVLHGHMRVVKANRLVFFYPNNVNKLCRYDPYYRCMLVSKGSFISPNHTAG